MQYFKNMPLFPLMTVLFPGQILRLHIFEERYHQLIADCLSGDEMFGVALIRHGKEVGDSAIPHPIGVTSKIHEIVKLDDGSLEVLCTGKKRFRIKSIDDRQAYLTCGAEILPWGYNPARDEPLVPILKHYLNEYLQLVREVSGNDNMGIQNLPQDTFNLACLTAISLKIPDLDKQHLLTTTTLFEFARDCLTLLRREKVFLERFSAFPDGFSEDHQFISAN